MKIFSLLFSMIILISASSAFADDVKGSKDHPLLNRYPDSFITEYSKNFNAIEMTTGTDASGAPKKEILEGDLTKLQYFYGSSETQPSPLQLIRNMQNAIKGIGGEVLFERRPLDTNSGETTLKVNQNGRTFFIQVLPEIYSAPTQSYRLNILEVEEMQQVVQANKLLDELNAKGFVTLYINFDTNKWDVKPESMATISEVAKMLQQSPTLNVSIEGHTDSVGAPKDNKVLSQNRANSVMTALVSSGVPATRLSAAGYGQEKPVASNDTEEGKAKNRRVEIVKKS